MNTIHKFNLIIIFVKLPNKNSIRPIALRRKKYLFAGSHQAAGYAVMMYLLFDSCRRNEIDPFLVQIPETKHFIDVRPVIDYITDVNNVRIDTALGEITSTIQTCIRYIATKFVYDIEEVEDPKEMVPQQVFATLFDMYDIFNGITVIKNNT